MQGTGYPPADTVAPEKQARANQLEVGKSVSILVYSANVLATTHFTFHFAR